MMSFRDSGRQTSECNASRFPAQRGVSLVGAATSAPASAAPAVPSVGSGSGRVSRASRARASEVESVVAPPPRPRHRTPEVHEDPGLEADDDDGELSEPALAEDRSRAEDEEREEVPVQHVDEDDEEEEEEDPNEPRYCYCGQGSFGEMIACDNDNCTMEWFHLQCTGLRNVPGDNGESIS